MMLHMVHRRRALLPLLILSASLLAFGLFLLFWPA
jgi:hypothetical protein